MKRRRSSFWDPAMLALEAQQVVALRMFKLACGGPAARREAERMYTEKIDAAGKVASMLAVPSADGPDRVVRMLRSRVRANRRRLLG